MEHADWAARWRDGHIAFHQASATPTLVAHADAAWGDGNLGRVLVPLCGKTLDMVYLAGRAEAVVGVEYVEQAVREFFAERGLTPTVDAVPHMRFHAAPYTLLAADFFALSPADIGTIDAAFDRASLVAFDPETRRRYAAQLGHLLPPGARLMLIAFDYDQAEMDGPPFSVPPAEVHELFEADFTVSQLGERDMLDDRFRQRGLSAMRETTFALTRTADPRSSSS